MDGIRQFLIDFFGPLAASQVSIFVLAGLAIAIVLLMAFLPTIEEMVVRASFGSDRNRFSSRMIRSAQTLQPTRESGWRDQMRDQIYRGGHTSDIILTDSDFFIFLRLALAISIGSLAALYVIVTKAPFFFMALPFLGYMGPSFYAGAHNRGRNKQIRTALPIMMPRLATAFDTEPDPRSAVSKVAKSDVGPLYDELDWAAGRMATVGNTYDVLRQLDRRNGIDFFAPLADLAEREAAQSYSRMRIIVRDYINEALNDHYGELDKRLGALPNKVIVTVAIPMMLGIMVTVIGPVILSVIDQLSHSGNPLIHS